MQGGFADESNVIDGGWNQYLFQDGSWTGEGVHICAGTHHRLRSSPIDSMGPYGPGALCPARDGSAGNCGMSFTNNWMRTDASGTTQHVNSTIANNTKISPGSPFPADAAAIVAAAGPRY